MKDDVSRTGNGELERLIRAEVDAALAEFRAADFEADFRRRIRERTGRKSGPVPLRALPAAAAIAAALMAIGAGLLLFLRPWRSPQGNIITAIETVLGPTPGGQALERKGMEPSRPAEVSPSPMSSQILIALMRAHQSPAAVMQTDRSKPSAGGSRRSRPMTLEEMYRILFIDRSIERVLALTS